MSSWIDAFVSCSVAKFNQNHDHLGRFSSSGAMSIPDSGGGYGGVAHSEARRDLEGEYWLQDGYAQYADSNDGMGHSGHAVIAAKQHVCDAFGFDYDSESDNWGNFLNSMRKKHPKEMDAVESGEGKDAKNVASKFLRDHGIEKSDWEVANDMGDIDPRVWAAVRLGWVRMEGNNVQLVGPMDKKKMKSIARGIESASESLFDPDGDILEKQVFTVEVLDKEKAEKHLDGWNGTITSTTYSDVPFTVLESGSTSEMRDYKSKRKIRVKFNPNHAQDGRFSVGSGSGRWGSDSTGGVAVMSQPKTDQVKIPDGYQEKLSPFRWQSNGKQFKVGISGLDGASIEGLSGKTVGLSSPRPGRITITGESGWRGTNLSTVSAVSKAVVSGLKRGTAISMQVDYVNRSIGDKVPPDIKAVVKSVTKKDNGVLVEYIEIEKKRKDVNVAAAKTLNLGIGDIDVSEISKHASDIVRKFNPNHGPDGRFSSGSGGSGRLSADKDRGGGGSGSGSGPGSGSTASDQPKSIADEKGTPPPPGRAYKPNVESDKNKDGVTDFARVGVPAMEVPPPPGVPRIPNLTEHERAVEHDFVSAFEKNPGKMAKDFLEIVNKSTKPGDPPTFGTDDAKVLSSKWSSSSLSLEERSQNRATLNTALHQTANAIAKRAFLMHLDTLQKGDSVMVTVGGCGAGKGYALKNVPEALAAKQGSKAVWDSAGDQNATENPWILAECQKRGLKTSFVYVHADPKTQWAHPERGVVKRAADPNDGRMVDAKVFADSYAIGAKNHQAFHDANKGNKDASFIFIQNGNPVKKLDGIPKEALGIDRKDLAKFAIETVEKSDSPPHIKRGATIGTRIWDGED